MVDESLYQVMTWPGVDCCGTYRGCYGLWLDESFYHVMTRPGVDCCGTCRGCYGLWLDESLYHGMTRPCLTYDNKLLTTSEDFTIAFLEVWGFK